MFLSDAFLELSSQLPETSRMHFCNQPPLRREDTQPISRRRGEQAAGGGSRRQDCQSCQQCFQLQHQNLGGCCSVWLWQHTLIQSHTWLVRHTQSCTLLGMRKSGQHWPGMMDLLHHHLLAVAWPAKLIGLLHCLAPPSSCGLLLQIEARWCSTSEQGCKQVDCHASFTWDQQEGESIVSEFKLGLPDPGALGAAAESCLSGHQFFAW